MSIDAFNNVLTGALDKVIPNSTMDVHSRSQNGGDAQQALQTTWRDPGSYMAGSPPDKAERPARRGGIGVF